MSHIQQIPPREKLVKFLTPYIRSWLDEHGNHLLLPHGFAKDIASNVLTALEQAGYEVRVK